MSDGYSVKDHTNLAVQHITEGVRALLDGKSTNARWALVKARQDITRALALMPAEDDRDAA